MVWLQINVIINEFWLSVKNNYNFILSGDLEHLRAVKEDKHNKFAKEKEMHSFKVSAKTGESVNLMFQQVAAQIYGITLTRIQVEDQQRVVKAEIVKFKEPKVAPLKPKKSSICVVS